MTENAWHDPIWQSFAYTITGLLIAVGVLLGSLTWGLKRPVASVWATYRGWCVMVPIVLGTIACGRTAVIGLVLLLSWAGFYEFARATELARDKLVTTVVMLLIFTLAVLCWMTDPRLNRLGWYGLFMAVPVYGIALLLTLPTLRNQPRGQLQTVSLAIVGFVYFGWMFTHLGFLANAQHAVGYLLYLFFAVSVNDIAAFTCGKLFGRRKLRNEISPNKTWGGAIGAVAVSLLLPWLLSFALPHFSPAARVMTGLIVGVGGQLGDLTISFIKRDLGVKDMGDLIPGHGGILDRIDSLIFTAPLFFHLVRWLYDL